MLAVREMRLARKIKFLAVPAMIAWTIAAYAALRGAPANPALLLAACLTLPLLAWLPADRTLTEAMRPPTRGRLRAITHIAAIISAVVRSPMFLRLVFLTAALTTGIWLALHRAPATEINATVVAKIAEFQQSQASGEPLFLIAENAPLASAISLHLANTEHAVEGHPPVYVVESPYADSQYALWPRYDQFTPTAGPPPERTGPDPFTEEGGVNRFVGRSALFVTTQAPDQLPQTITAAFAAHRLLGEIGLPTGRVLRVYLCSDYQTLPL